jgi:bacterioferritin
MSKPGARGHGNPWTGQIVEKFHDPAGPGQGNALPGGVLPPTRVIPPHRGGAFAFGGCGILRPSFSHPTEGFMQGSPEIVRHLNDLLRGELAAINQYFLHASMYRNWGYHKLHKKMNEESIEEMKHAEKLMERILEKEGLPEMRDGIALCLQQGDNVTRDLIERLLVDSEAHVFWLESQLHLIRQVGVENYCAQQI